MSDSAPTPREKAKAAFIEWFERNYPPDCILSRPSWHAPKVFRAAEASLNDAGLLQSESSETFDQLMTQRLPSIQHEAREYIRRMRLLDGGDIDEQKMRFAEAALAMPAKKPRATASPYDCGANPMKDYPGE